MKTNKMVAGLSLVAAFFACVPSAFADPPKTLERYSYEFSDEKLLGKDMAPAGDLMPFLKLGLRDRLLRPRVQFVVEMLKSVENM